MVNRLIVFGFRRCEVPEAVFKENVVLNKIQMEYNDYWEFLARMTREMWKPMNDISIYKYVLKEEEYRPSLAEDEWRELLYRMDSRCHHLVRILNRLENISHYSSIDKLDLSDRVPVNHLCRELIAEQDTDIAFRSTLTDDTVLMTNEDGLMQLLATLFEQAVNRVLYSKRVIKGDSILLDVSGGPSKVVFSISDKGDPITREEAVSAFFLPTRQKGSDFMRRLELHICSLIVKHLGGVIFIDPDYTPGRCVIFEISQQGQSPL